MSKSGCERVALLFRVRRLLALSVRSVLYGDVPLGSFWFGWHETAWTPNGFEGWTTGKRQRAIVPRPTFAWLRGGVRASTTGARLTAPAPVASESQVGAGPRIPEVVIPRLSAVPTPTATSHTSDSPVAVHDKRAA
jgi:hypothetical protein